MFAPFGDACTHFFVPIQQVACLRHSTRGYYYSPPSATLVGKRHTTEKANRIDLTIGKGLYSLPWKGNVLLIMERECTLYHGKGMNSLPWKEYTLLTMEKE